MKLLNILLLSTLFLFSGCAEPTQESNDTEIILNDSEAELVEESIDEVVEESLDSTEVIIEEQSGGVVVDNFTKDEISEELKEELEEESEVSYYDVETYIAWTKSGSGYWTYHDYYNIYNDFDYMVSRSIKPDASGYYYYDIWFFSQSYYWDGKASEYTSTNVKGVEIYVGTNANNVQLTTSDYSSLGITFNEEYAPNSLRFKSQNKYPVIVILWKQMSAK